MNLIKKKFTLIKENKITDQNIFLATGTGRKGILLGPAMGNIISQLITGQKLEVDITSFSPNRFN